jgi:hypothetical protein
MQRLRMRDPSEVSDLIERYIKTESPRLGRRRLHSSVLGATSVKKSPATEKQHRHDDDE